MRFYFGYNLAVAYWGLAMDSFDDIYFFYLVVKHGGFSAASEVSGISKSKLSRRLLQLEKRFNIQLIQRSTRHFKVTIVGLQFFDECTKVLDQVEAAQCVLLKEKSEPEGLIKISCPSLMMHFQIRQIINAFLKEYPKIQIEVKLTSHHVDILHEDIDVAIRTSFTPTEDSNLIVRDIIRTSHCLVVNPNLLGDWVINRPEDLHALPSVCLGLMNKSYEWVLKHQISHEIQTVAFTPRLKCNDLAGVYYAVTDGIGVADMPYLIVENDIRQGNLVQLLPDWCTNIGTVQLIYASRKGQRRVVELLIDALVRGFQSYAMTHSGYLKL